MLSFDTSNARMGVKWLYITIFAKRAAQLHDVFKDIAGNKNTQVGVIHPDEKALMLDITPL